MMLEAVLNERSLVAATLAGIGDFCSDSSWALVRSGDKLDRIY